MSLIMFMGVYVVFVEIYMYLMNFLTVELVVWQWSSKMMLFEYVWSFFISFTLNIYVFPSLEVLKVYLHLSSIDFNTYSFLSNLLTLNWKLLCNCIYRNTFRNPYLVPKYFIFYNSIHSDNWNDTTSSFIHQFFKSSQDQQY